MDKLFNEELFDVLLEKTFVEHERKVQKTYPDDEELEKKYPTNRKSVKKYKRIFKEKEYGRKLIWLYVNRAAVVFLCIISLFFSFVMINYEVRASVENVILNWYDKYTEFIFNKTSDEFDSYELEDYKIGYIPEDFELQYEENFDDIRDMCFMNTEKDDAIFVIQIFDPDKTSVCVDNEQMLYKKTEIGSREAWIMYNDAEEYGSVLVADTKFSILVVGDLSKEEIIKVAENIK